MNRPPIADPSGEVFTTSPIAPTPKHFALARALNWSAWMVPACVLFTFWDLAILGLIGEYRRGVVKIDAGTTWIFAVGAIFLWIRLWIGIRIARRLGDSTVWLTSIGLVLGIVNSFVFISMNSRAAAKLRAAGVNVGLFGVYPREMRKLKAAASSGVAEPNQNG